MKLPVKPGYAPMEARVVTELPTGPEWQYEPKWDGFRCLAFRDGDSVEMRSKSGQTLTRYFPEVAAALRALPSKRFVVDGEIVVSADDGLSFDALLQRIHPAQSRIDKLSRETPGTFLVFDLLVDARGTDLTMHPLSDRRARLDAFAAANLRKTKTIALSPMTTSLAEAKRWLAGQSGTDGVMAKRTDVPYASGERTAMVKVKRKRTADCVVGGFRYASKGRVIGSLLLGLYDDDGLLHHVGFTSSFTAKQRAEFTAKVEPLRGGEGFTGQAPGGPSRWSTARSSEWEPLEPTLVVEVEYDHFTSGRFRHGTKFLRWRPDKAPRQCLLTQVAEARNEKRAKSARAREGALSTSATTRKAKGRVSRPSRRQSDSARKRASPRR